MALLVVCDFCRTRYRFRDALAGSSALCEHCGNVLEVPHGRSGRAALNGQAPDVGKSSAGSNGHVPPPAVRRSLVCPDCGLELPADIVFCGRCGTDLRDLSPVQPKPLRTAPALRDPARLDSARPAVSDSLHKVGWGLRLVLWDILATGLAKLILWFAPYLLIHQIGRPATYQLMAAAQLSWAGMLLVGMVGRLLCLAVPGESRARIVIFITVALDLFAVVTNLAYTFDEVTVEIFTAGKIASLAAHVLFLLFLVRLARYLRRGDLVGESRRAMRIGMALVLLEILTALARNSPDFAPIAFLVMVATSVLALFLFIPYMIQLARYCRAMERHTA